MRRYMVKRPKSAPLDDFQVDAEKYLATTVYETELTPEPTGVLDAQGNELYAFEEREPIGFALVEFAKAIRDD